MPNVPIEMSLSSQQHRPTNLIRIISSLLLILNLPLLILASDSSSAYDDFDYSIYGMSMQRDWMYDSKTISIKFLGCVWGYVDANNAEDMGCMENDSEDGTTSWYQMANCRRAQVAYGMYSSSGTTYCKNKDFQESLVTKNGVAEFVYLLEAYGYNSPVSSDDSGSFPMCEGDGNGYYMSVGCTSDGGFSISRFYDQYCLEYFDTYDKLSSFNSAMNKLSCFNCYDSSSDEDISYSVASLLTAESGSCSESESQLCTTSSFVANSGSGYQRSHNFGTSSASFGNKLKYTLGSAMLIGSVVMFFGILFTNRRKRHAMMHRKFRQGTDKKKKKKPRSSSKKSSASRSSSRRRSSNNSGVFA